jgi:hypothetical protein
MNHIYDVDPSQAGETHIGFSETICFVPPFYILADQTWGFAITQAFRYVSLERFLIVFHERKGGGEKPRKPYTDIVPHQDG